VFTYSCSKPEGSQRKHHRVKVAAGNRRMESLKIAHAEKTNATSLYTRYP
jgi:hypothetical protein